MSEFISAGPLADLASGASKRIEHEHECIAVFNVDGTIYAISNTCPHAGAPLYQGHVDGTVVSCPWHGWSFELRPDKEHRPDGVYRYPVIIEDGEIRVMLEKYEKPPRQNGEA